jgi:thioredoxin-related protein
MQIGNSLLIIMVLINMSFTYAQEWQTDFVIAKEIASKENKPIILVFQGSDWCAPCIKLNIEVWSTDEFEAYSKKHFVMLQADFPKRKANALDPAHQERNNKLAETYNSNGYFPYVVVLNDKGTVLGSTGYKRMPVKEYIELLESFKP